MTPIEPGQVFLEWAAAEQPKTDAARRHLAGGISHVGEEAQLAGLVVHRHFLLAFFLLNRTEWFAGELTPAELGEARTLACFPDDPTRLLKDLARNWPRALPDFSVAAMVGRPILVSAALGAQPCLVDGYNRSCSLLRQRAPTVATVPVYLGVCPNLERWRWYR